MFAFLSKSWKEIFSSNKIRQITKQWFWYKKQRTRKLLFNVATTVGELCKAVNKVLCLHFHCSKPLPELVQ